MLFADTIVIVGNIPTPVRNYGKSFTAVSPNVPVRTQSYTYNVCKSSTYRYVRQ